MVYAGLCSIVKKYYVVFIGADTNVPQFEIVSLIDNKRNVFNDICIK